MKPKKGDILLVIILAAAIISYFGIRMLNADTPDKTIIIQINGMEYERIPMGGFRLDKRFHIELEEGRFIDIRAGNKGARVTDVKCPDRVCEKTGIIDSPGQSIVCLPNRVFIYIEGNNAAETKLQ